MALLTKSDRNPRLATLSRSLLAAGLLIGTCAAARAAAFDTGVPELNFRWDNTVKYSTAYRLKDPDPALVRDLNFDDGDRNFKKGIISNRLDILSEADLTWRDLGARVSAAGWYDSVYNHSNDNNSAGSFGPGTSTVNSTGPYNQFLPSTRTLHGRKTDWLDAFVFGRFDINGMRASLRLGKFAQVWGESVFFGANAIGGAMTPVDIVKLVSVPNTQFKETILQIPQVAGQLQITSDVSVGAYYQFRYRPSRYPGVGSYFSGSDTTVYGGQFTYLGPFATVPTQSDLLPKNGGQGGVQLRFSANETDYGLYAIRFHDKGFQIVPTLGVGPGGVAPSSFRAEFHQGITAFGGSFSRTFGDANVAGEASIRNNMDLASTHGADTRALAIAGGAPPQFAPVFDNSSNPAYAVGKTAHINLSTLWQVPRSPLWTEATFVGEVAWNRVLSCQKNCGIYSYALYQANPQAPNGTIDPNSTRDAVNLRGVFAPAYRQVIPGVDLSVPIGLGYAPRGSRSRALGAGASIADGGGDISLGVSGTYLDVWRFSLSATHYFGPANTFLAAPAGSAPGTPSSFSYGQTLRDRDFIAFSLARTF
jgi:hypothetical protein